MLKKIVVIVTALLLVGLVVFLWNVNSEEQREAQKLEKMDDARRPLLVERHEIEQQIVDLEKNYEANKMPKGTTQVIFTGLEADVYNICYPIMKELEYTGTLAISMQQLPGMEGLMTLEQFQELIKEGWKICVKWDSENPVSKWWPDLQKRLNEFGFESCSVMYFTTGTYTGGLDAQLQQMGFSIVVHHGEETTSLIQLNDEEGIWHIGAVGLMGEKPKLRLTEAIAQKGNITYLVGFELEDERYDERSFRSMLGYFESYENNLELIITDAEGARQHYRERATAYEQAKEEAYKIERAELEKKLAKVEEELAKLEVQ